MHRIFAGTILVILLLADVSMAELKDPTRPSYATSDGVTAVIDGVLRVSAVFISGERRVAIVNGRRLRVGDAVEGATISRIEQDRVSFVRGDEVFAVSLLSGSSRK